MASNEMLGLLSEEEKLRKQKVYQESVTKRHEERVAKMEKRQVRNKHKPEESQDYFWKQFNSQNSNIQSLFEQITQSADPIPIIKEIDAEIETLQKYMNDSTLFLNAFDLRISLGMLQNLQNELSREREKFAPRKKFGFKSRQRQVENGTVEIQKETTEPPLTKEPKYIPMPENKNTFTIQDRKGENIVINHDAVLNKDLIISNLDSCSLTIHSSPSTLHMTNIASSTVSIGPLRTSIMIHDSTNSRFSLACQQLRIHTSTQCDFYIHVTSRAIIEDSRQLRFAPFSCKYSVIEEDYATSRLDRNVNNWEIINDFNWLSSNEASPNWCLIGEGDRIVWNLT